MKNLDTTFITKKRMKKDIESFMNAPVPFSMTEIEGKYLSREKKEDEDLMDKAIFAFILILALFIGITIEKFVIDPMLAPYRAEAAEIEPIRQNDYYCAQIAEGNMKVNPKEVTANDLLALCAKYL